jgi:hypothetical protein
MLPSLLKRLFARSSRPDWQSSSGASSEPNQSEAFVWLNKNGVRGRDGFVVQSTGRFTIEYREGSLKVAVEVERMVQGEESVVAIERDAFARWDGLSYDLAHETQVRMLENFTAAMAFQGIRVEF